MNEPVASVEEYAAWTIPAFSVEMRKDVVAAAASRKMKVGAFLEMVWKSYLADGSPVQIAPIVTVTVARTASAETLVALATLAQATRDMAAAAGIEPPASLAKSLLALTAAQTRSARGLSPRTKPPVALTALNAP